MDAKLDAKLEHHARYNETTKAVNNTQDENAQLHSQNADIFIFSSICVVCAFGLVGNGLVIWLLGFRMKRNSFTTYILNLAVADFGVLIALLSEMVIYIAEYQSTHHVHFADLFLFILMYSISQLLLTAISIDRCVAVIFPIWYRCHRPPRLSAIVCSLIWVLFFVCNGIITALTLTGKIDTSKVHFPLAVNGFVCLPLISISTFVLLIKVFLMPQQRRRGKLSMAILLTLLLFLVFAFPLNVISLFNYYAPSDLLKYFSHFKAFCYLTQCTLLGASLNSSVNPLIYYLVGQKKGGQSRQNMKVILQRVFKEEQVSGTDVEPQLETP